MQSKSEEKYTIVYKEGYDGSFFSGDEAMCLMGNRLAEALGVTPGDTITLLSFDRMFVLSSLSENEEEFATRIKEASRPLTVVGVITSEDPHICKGIYAPLSKTIEQLSDYVEYPFPIEFAEFVLVDKDNPYKLKDYLDKLASLDHKYTEEVSYNMDTTELDNIKRVRDMLIQLFPIAVAGAVIIGLIAPLLMVLQSAKEAAILRILGTTKRRTRCMFALEQIGLCIFGLLLAFLGLAIYDFGLFIRSIGSLMLCGGLYLLGCALAVTLASMEITRRKALELLQVKE